MRKIALERPPRIDAILARAPAALIDLQAQMVARDPEDRPATARDVATKLRAFAVTAGGPSSRRVIPATMTALFADDARKRRDRLAVALQEASPNAVVLARDDELAMSGSPAGETSSRNRRWLVPAVIASCALGLGAVAFVPRRPPPAIPPRAGERVAPTSEALPEPTPIASESAPEVATAGPPIEATAVKPPPSRNLTHHAKPALLVKPASTSKLPDVDPSPF
jgi:hypothetical protein